MRAKFKGLTTSQVEESRRLHGQNILTPTERESVWKRFIEKFKDPLILILIVAGVLSLGISIYEFTALDAKWSAFFEPAGILIAILLATVLAFVFEMKADKEFMLLNQVNDEEMVIVIRSGRYCKIPKKDVVVGDVVSIQSGDEVPADGRLLESVALNVNESALTGEQYCRKSADPADARDTDTYPTNCVYRGTKVMEGHAIYEVTAVGDATEYGKVYRQAQIDNGVRTPLNEQLDKLGTWISVISYVIAGLIVLGKVIFYVHTYAAADFDWFDFAAYLLKSLMVAVTLIVVAVPEGLPMAVTLSLAYSMRKMMATNNLVRKMHACETMGATTVICTDKTGTLTQNQMRVGKVWLAPGIENADLFPSIAVNSTASLDEKGAVVGNPTEGALILWMRSLGVDYFDLRASTKVLDELPFSPENKYMACLADLDGEKTLLLKGAPEIICNFCDISSDQRDEILAFQTECQKKAMRIIGFAVKQMGDSGNFARDGKFVANGLRLIALAAISDPVREDVPGAVSECLNAGIDVKIVTGDNPNTAAEIGRQIGIWSEDSDKKIITGPELAQMSDKDLEQEAKSFAIIARARPTDKERLVRALQARGEVVAVTGDGTNDAPALNAAHVGLSMGDGTSVAKEASDITIIDNSFTSIGRAVLWGRTLFRNIQRFILFQMTVNVAACLIVLAGAFMGLESPLTVTQMLWINLIMDTFAAMALASLPSEKELMNHPPRNRRDFIIEGGMLARIILVGGSFSAIMIGFVWILEHANIYHGMAFDQLRIGAYDGISAYESSIFFTTFVFLQFWNLFNVKAYGTNRSAFNLRDCKGFLTIIAMILVGQLAIIYLGGEFFNVMPLELDDLLMIIGITSVVIIVGEFFRWVMRSRRS